MIYLNKLYDFAKNYDVILCDIWGVLHDGVATYSQTVEELKQLKQQGKYIVLITNSPRLHSEITQDIAAIGIDKLVYHALVTSGDATLQLMQMGPRKFFYIGSPERVSLTEKLELELCEEQEAQALLCTGLSPEIGFQLEYYEKLLVRLRSRNLPFICANPDIFVLSGGRHIWCAGALARAYSQLGGRVHVAGKPHLAIYELAQSHFEQALGKVEKSQILAIGDGFLTDIKGAENFGVDSVFVARGMHQREYVVNGVVDKNKLESFIKEIGFIPKAIWGV